jgi:hypothetical protein
MVYLSTFGWFLRANVAKYSSTMENMGREHQFMFICFLFFWDSTLESTDRLKGYDFQIYGTPLFPHGLVS